MRDIALVICMVLCVFLTGCADKDRLDNLGESITAKQVELDNLQKQIDLQESNKESAITSKNSEIEEIKNELNSAKNGLKALKVSLVAAELVKSKLDGDLEGMFDNYPITSLCIVSQGAWTGIAVSAFSDDIETQQAGLLISATCGLNIMLNNDYEYVKERLIDINLKLIAANTVVTTLQDKVGDSEGHVSELNSAAEINIAKLTQNCDEIVSSCNSKINELSGVLTGTESELDQLYTEYKCEKNLFCRIKSIIFG